MDDTTSNMLGIIPPLLIGGALMMFTKKFIEEPMQIQRRKAKRFDEQECKDLKCRGRKLGLGDFSNINW